MFRHFWKNSQFTETVVWGILLLIVLIIPADEGGNGYIIQLIIQVLLLCGATLWAIRVLRRRNLTLTIDWLDLVILGFLGWAIGSAIFSEYAYTSILELIKLGSYAVLLYMLRMFYPFKQRQTSLLLAILISSVLQCLLAWGFLLAQRTPVLQAAFVNPNNFAQFLVFGVNIALSFVLFAHAAENASKRKIFFQKCGLIALLLALIITILAVKSRGAFVSLAATGFFLTILKNKKLGMLFVLFCCIAVFLPTPWGSIFQKLQKRHDPFAYQRIDIWQSSLRMAADYPIFGVGLGMYKFYGMEYNFPVEHQIARYGKYLNIAHSDFLQIATELGIVGLMLFLAGIGRMAWYSLRGLRTSPLTWPVAAATAGAAGLLIHGLFSTLLTSPALALVGCIFVAILLDAATAYRQTSLVLHTRRVWYAALGFAVFCLLIPVIVYPFLAHHHYLQYFNFRAQRDIPQAVAHLKQAIAYVPIHAAYHRTFGELYLTAFRNAPTPDAFYEGYQSFTRAIRCNRRDYDAYQQLGKLHQEMFYKKLRARATAQNALEAYQQALRYKPYDPFILSSMASLHADLNEFERAISLLRRAVTFEPNFVGGYQLLGRMLAHLDRQAEAQQAFQQVEMILDTYQPRPQQSEYTQLLLRSIQ